MHTPHVESLGPTDAAFAAPLVSQDTALEDEKESICTWLFQLTRSAQIFLGIVMIEMGGIIAYCCVLSYYSLEANSADGVTQPQMRYYAGCLFALALTMGSMGVDCLRTENTVELMCVLMMTLFMCGVTMYVVVTNFLSDDLSLIHISEPTRPY